ncbi:MAG TPA: TonB-dependent receptor, partial [Brumimicrobium sp.]|nr:TonB-dependent receptor [Brumimicrobium sp.]
MEELKKWSNKMLLLAIAFTALSIDAKAQDINISGTVRDKQTSEALEFVNVHILGTNIGAQTDDNGFFRLKIPQSLESGKLVASYIGYDSDTISLTKVRTKYDFRLLNHSQSLGEVVVTGTMKEVSKLDSPVPVEVYTAKFFKANPTPSIFESLQNVNGVSPQLNCNVCNTGDIHINGLEGPYTMIVIDGMPIVSGLSTVYGLSGIP